MRGIAGWIGKILDVIIDILIITTLLCSLHYVSFDSLQVNIDGQCMPIALINNDQGKALGTDPKMRMKMTI